MERCHRKQIIFNYCSVWRCHQWYSRCWHLVRLLSVKSNRHLHNRLSVRRAVGVRIADQRIDRGVDHDRAATSRALKEDPLVAVGLAALAVDGQVDDEQSV